MAGLDLHVTSGEVACAASAAVKTVLQIKAPTNQRLVVIGFKVMGKSAAGGTDPGVKLRLTRSTSNFGTGSSATPAKLNPSNGETVQSTAFGNFTIEPTSPSDCGVTYEVNPQSGVIEYYPFDKPWPVPGGQSLQIEATAVSGQTPTLAYTFAYSE